MLLGCHTVIVFAMIVIFIPLSFELETLSVDTEVHCEFQGSNSGRLSRDGESAHDHMIIQYW